MYSTLLSALAVTKSFGATPALGRDRPRGGRGPDPVRARAVATQAGGYWWILGFGMAAAPAVALFTTAPLMGRLTAPETARFEWPLPADYRHAFSSSRASVDLVGLWSIYRLCST